MFAYFSKGPKGMQAVRVLGRGGVTNVRVIQLSAQHIFWFDVEVAESLKPFQPVRGLSLQPGVSRSHIPAWAQSTTPLFPAQILRDSAKKRAALRDDPAPDGLSKSESIQTSDRLTKRSKTWQQRY